MKAYQLTVPAQNKPGQLAAVTAVLAKENINVRGITISSFGPQGFFNILVDDPKGAQKALVKDGFSVEMKEVVSIIIDDKPGSFHKMIQLLADENINVLNSYGFVLESKKTAVIVIEVDQIDKTVELLERNKYKTITAEGIAAIEPFSYINY
jgi:hypothetical protein